MVFVLFSVGLVIFSSLGYALIAPIFFVALTTIEGHFVTPNIVGRNLSLSPLIVFLVHGTKRPIASEPSRSALRGQSGPGLEPSKQPLVIRGQDELEEAFSAMTKAPVRALLLIALLAPMLTVAAGVIVNRNLRSSNERSLFRNEPAKTSFPHASQADPGPR